MSILVSVLAILGVIIGTILLLAAFIKKQHFVKREIVIHAPLSKVFQFLRMVENQEKFNKWATTDPDRKKEFKGVDGTVGFVYSWSGNRNAGEGQKEIKQIIEGKKIETEVRFVKPMAVTSSMIMETEPVSEERTKVYLTNSGKLKYPLNIMIPIAEKNFARDMDESLLKLKRILEK